MKELLKQGPETGPGGFVQKKTPARVRAPSKNRLSADAETTAPFEFNLIRRRLPPYGIALAQKLRQDKPANVVWVACGERAWKRSKHDLRRPDSWATLLPPGEDPASYRWPVVGCDCLVIHTGGLSPQELKNLCRCLIRAGANKAIAPSQDPAMPSIYLYPRRAA